MRLKIVVLLALFASLLLPMATATAQSELPTAAVSMGDSYISGEAGRWMGNSPANRATRGGTDRAAYRRWFGYRYDPTRIYGDTYSSGCHRSDVAPINSASLNVDMSINIACSGADTGNVKSAASGGTSYRGEAPQVDQLAQLARTVNVEVVVLSVGGNDLGFANAIIDCVTRYSTSTRWAPNTCAGPQGRNVANRMPAAMAGVAQSIADIHAALAAAGDTNYRIILQSYPVPLPSGSDFRYSQYGWDRVFTGGCPFWNSDADWANDELVPQIRDNLAAVAAAGGAEFLDLTNALDGREACASTASHGPGSNAEWIRFVATGIGQGDAQESVHPNFYGQQAMGRCLQLHVAAGVGNYTCTNRPGGTPQQMDLS